MFLKIDKINKIKHNQEIKIEPLKFTLFFTRMSLIDILNFVWLNVSYDRSIFRNIVWILFYAIKGQIFSTFHVWILFMKISIKLFIWEFQQFYLYWEERL